MAEKKNSLSMRRGLLYVGISALVLLGCYDSKKTAIITGEITDVHAHSGTYSFGYHYGVSVKKGDNTFYVAVPLSLGKDKGLEKKAQDMTSPPESISVLAHLTGPRLFSPTLVVSENGPCETW